jgi:hypothetical protein
METILAETENVRIGTYEATEEFADDHDDIISQLRQESDSAVGAHDGQLAEDIERLNNYYAGHLYGDEVDGKSKFVTREVYETIESIIPYLMKIFFSSDKAVVFDPEDEDDVAGAQQETEYVNWVFYRSNEGFKIGYNWIKDGLMNKIGYVKIARESPQTTTERYENLDAETLQATIADVESRAGDVEISILVEDTGGDPQATLVVRRVVGEEKTCVYNVPPEEIRVSDGDTDLRTARYVAHSSERTLSEIRAMGFEIDDDAGDNSDSNDLSSIKQDRHGDVSQLFSDDEGTGATRKVFFREEYLRVDRDGDGIAELWQFFRVGDEILSEKEVADCNIYSWSPIITPHRHVGGTPAEPMMDIQRLKSKTTRNLLDNHESINRGRYGVIDGEVNLDDLMANGPIVRMNFDGAVKPLPTPPLDQSAFQVLGYADSLGEKRSGVSERGQGLDPKMFNSNTAMGTAEIVMSSAEQKLELIARIFGETGLKQLFLGIHRMGLMSEPKQRKIRTNNGEFVSVNPREWRDRFDMGVTVGIGNGSKNQQMFQMQMIEQTMQTIVSGGGMGSLITPENIWNFAMEKVRVAGRKDGNLFFSNPEKAEPQGPTPEQELAELQKQLLIEELKIKQKEVEIDEAKVMLEAEQLEFEKQQHADENEFKLAELQVEIDQKRGVSIGES